MTAPIPTPFRKILIANRGEIALRVMRSARALGYRTVAVYSTADAEARHVREADEAVCIGAPLPAQSYLNIEAVIAAAKAAGADAVHPGYGFLAENAAFADACKAAGLVFIGPSAEAIRAMGNKAGAKSLMEKAGVPCIPGYQGTDQSEGRLATEAERIGFPVMIKAAAGGGGRGMRLVKAASAFAEELRAARSEAQAAFGDQEVILERAIIEPRHIEIQIFADRSGNVIHLGERDCSVQRRHQKVIEEAPSPAVDAELRTKMGATAVTAAKAIAYEGAGTLEFLLDGAGHFYFMEMNTRLQVEHPVTEAITGLDLVALQLQVAAGEKLPLTQEDVRFTGHAIEVRLCAEDAMAGFMPQSGRIALWEMPAHLRIEDGLASGADIPPYYDSMIAKIIAHGTTREDARRKLTSGLEDTVALGVTTNQAFLHRCLTHPVFAAGAATTGFIAQHAEALTAPDEAARVHAAALGAVLLCTPTSARRADRLVNTLPRLLLLDIAGSSLKATITATAPHRSTIAIGDETFAIEIDDCSADTARLLCNGIAEHVRFAREGTTLHLHARGGTWSINDKTLAPAARLADAGGDGKLRASMNGRVVGVMVAVGDRVEAGQAIVVLEAMKMEHTHTASVSGEVTALHVQAGDQVMANRVVAEIAAVLDA